MMDVVRPKPLRSVGRRTLSQQAPGKFEIGVDTLSGPDYIRPTNDGGDAAGDREVRF